MIKLSSKATFLLFTIIMSLSTTAQELANDNSQKEKVLFNSKNTNGWHTFNEDKVDDIWQVKDGILTLNHHYEGKGDLVTDDVFENYILELEWRVKKGANSGILINVQEGSRFSQTYETGPEMQVLDNIDADDNKEKDHLAGSLYDLSPSNPNFVRPVGQWNKVKIKQKNGEITFWLNGNRVINTTIGSDEWKKMVNNSKFHDWENFGKSIKGHIALQDHGDDVAFKNIKIKEL